MSNWSEGYLAYETGSSIEENPYVYMSGSYFDWRSGWIYAELYYEDDYGQPKE